MSTVVETPQHLVALQLANEIRFARADWKRRVRAGQASIVELLEDPPGEIEGMLVFDLIACQWRWGRERTRRLLLMAGVSERKTVRGLTERQRHALIVGLAPTGRRRA